MPSPPTLRRSTAVSRSEDFVRALAAANLSSRHRELALRVARLVHEDALQSGDRILEVSTAEKLGVSRTPLRSALEFLAMQGFLEHQKNRGFLLVERPPLLVTPSSPSPPEDALVLQIAAERRVGTLTDDLTEMDLMRTYCLSRSSVKALLNRLIELGIVERGLAFHYKFVDQAYDAKTKAEGYRYRLMVEPQSLLEPGFGLPTGWIEEMRSRHEWLLKSRSNQATSIAFYEVNVAFHEGLVAGNQYALEGLKRVNKRRQLSNYDTSHARLQQSCREHLEIIGAIEMSALPHASRLLREHIALASKLPERGQKRR